MVIKNQMNLPVFPEDHHAFKIEASENGKSIKEFFHEIVEERKKRKPQNPTVPTRLGDML